MRIATNDQNVSISFALANDMFESLVKTRLNRRATSVVYYVVIKIIKFYAQATSGKIARSDWLFSGQDSAVMSVGEYGFFYHDKNSLSSIPRARLLSS